MLDKLAIKLIQKKLGSAAFIPFFLEHGNLKAHEVHAGVIQEAAKLLGIPLPPEQSAVVAMAVSSMEFDELADTSRSPELAMAIASKIRSVFTTPKVVEVPKLF